MNNMDNVYVEMAHKKTQFSEKTSTFVKSNLSTIALVICIVVTIVKELYELGYVNPFSVVFFLNLFTDASITMFCYAVFIPFGKRGEITSNTSYTGNLQVWGKRSSEIRVTGKLSLFNDYCRKQVELEREEIRRMIIFNETTIEYEVYIEKYAGLKKSEIKKLYKAKKIAKEEKRAILRAKKVKVKPIKPLLILCGVQKASINDAGRSTNHYVAIWYATRPLIILSLAILRSCTNGTFVGTSHIYGMMMSILSIVIASGIGYSAGSKSIQRENELVKNRILFIDGFLEKENTNCA